MKRPTAKHLARTVLWEKINGFCDFSQELEDLGLSSERYEGTKYQMDFDRHLNAYIRRINKLLKDGEK